jgi:hypothetical protein
MASARMHRCAGGGVSIRRGRRDPERLRLGDTVDWCRVESFIPDRQLWFIADMRRPKANAIGNAGEASRPMGQREFAHAQ